LISEQKYFRLRLILFLKLDSSYLFENKISLGGGSDSEKTMKGGIILCRERGLTGSAVCPAFNFVENRSIF